MPNPPAEAAAPDDSGRGLFRGLAFAALPATLLWALIIWLAWRFWPF